MLDGRGPTTTARRPRSGSPTPTTAGTRCRTALSRLRTRFWGRDDALAAAAAAIGKELLAADAADAGLVTFTPDDIDWDDEVRADARGAQQLLARRPDRHGGQLRFVGPETMETKIFARLSAWQNWIFQRPNAVGPEGALRRFGTGLADAGLRPSEDRTV